MSSALVPRRRRAAIGAVAVLLGASLALAPPVVAAPAPCTDPPAVFPIGDVEPGLMATGWTVLQGTEPVSFDVELLGVQPDAIAAGFDVIVVKVSGAAIEEIGGIAAGFSGSPVYLGDELVGSLSWSTDDPRYGALTPGQRIVDLLGLPGGKEPTARAFDLIAEMRRAIARDAGVELTEVATSMSTIPVSLALSGVEGERVSEVAARFERRGLAVVPFGAGATSASPRVVTGDPFAPGDAFTAAVSYGSVTYAGIGTVTATCGDSLIAFGHYFTHAGGGRSAAALEADVLAVTGGDYPFKLANVGALRGVIDQDRFTGIRAVIGAEPPSPTTVSMEVVNEDLGTTLETASQVVDREWLTSVVWDHVYGSIHAGLDADAGTARATWTVDGTAAGVPFSVTMRTVHTGNDAVWGPADDVTGSISTLMHLPGNMKIATVDVHVTATETRLGTARVHEARTATDTSPVFEARRSVNVAPGDTLAVKVPVVAPDGTVTFVRADFVIPESVTGNGRLEFRIDDADFWFRTDSLDAALWKLTHQLMPTEMRITVRMRGMERPLAERVELPWLLRGTPGDVELELL